MNTVEINNGCTIIYYLEVDNVVAAILKAVGEKDYDDDDSVQVMVVTQFKDFYRLWRQQIFLDIILQV